MDANSKIIKKICTAITESNEKAVKLIIKKEYPHSPITKHQRRYTDKQKLQIYLRDGFIDRYSGKKLIFPPVLRIISHLYPVIFPFHKNWKFDECHISYWQLVPTIDHIIPIARGGLDRIENMVSTSQLKNSIKSSWLLEELNWRICPIGQLSNWDGLINWYIHYIDKNEIALKDPYFKKWYTLLKNSL